MTETTILIRLGRVLYWAAAALASIPFLIGVFFAAAHSSDRNGGPLEGLGFFVAGCIGAGVVWAIG